MSEHNLNFICSKCLQSNSNQFLKINNNLFYCSTCNSIISLRKSSFQEDEKEVSDFSINPNDFSFNSQSKETIPSFIPYFNIDTKSNSFNKFSFINKAEYLKIRQSIIKLIKTNCNYFELSKKTYFLSVGYFDRICSQLIGFNKETLIQIALFCIIMATKYQENIKKAIVLQNNMKNFISTNYIKDEIYILNLLKYDLNILTPYDYLQDLMNSGFIFNSEINISTNIKKINQIYSKLENMLIAFSESKYYIEQSPLDTAVSLCGFVRENLGLLPFNYFLTSIFDNNKEEINELSTCLNNIRHCFIIKKNTKKIFKEENINKNKIKINKDKNNNPPYENENSNKKLFLSFVKKD